MLAEKRACTSDLTQAQDQMSYKVDVLEKC